MTALHSSWLPQERVILREQGRSHMSFMTIIIIIAHGYTGRPIKCGMGQYQGVGNGYQDTRIIGAYFGNEIPKTGFKVIKENESKQQIYSQPSIQV